MLWAALPHPSTADVTMDRLAVMGQTLHHTQRGRGWPGEGPHHPGLMRVAASFTAATAALSGEQPPTPRGAPGRGAHPSTDPAVVVRVRVIHTLYVAAHAVGLAVREDQPGTARPGPTTLSPSAADATDVAVRLLAFEHAAGAYLGNPRPPSMGANSRPVGVEGALAEWDVTAQRTLTAHPTPANVVMIARVQAALLVATGTAIRAAAANGHGGSGAHGDADGVAHRVRPVLADARRAWSALAGQWQDLLSPATRRPDPGLTATASTLHAHLADVVAGRTPTTNSTRASAADRGPGAVQGPAAATVTVAVALRQSLGTGVDIAHLIRDAATYDPDLRGPARVLARRASDDAEHLGTPGMGAWVNVRDVHDNRMVPIPRPVRDALTNAGDVAVAAMVTAMSASAALEHHTPAARDRVATPDAAAALARRPPPAAVRLANVPARAGPGR